MTVFTRQWHFWRKFLFFQNSSDLRATNSEYGEGNGTPLQCSYLENPRDGGAYRRGCHLWGHTESDTTDSWSNLAAAATLNNQWHQISGPKWPLKTTGSGQYPGLKNEKSLCVKEFWHSIHFFFLAKAYEKSPEFQFQSRIYSEKRIISKLASVITPRGFY